MNMFSVLGMTWQTMRITQIFTSKQQQGQDDLYNRKLNGSLDIIEPYWLTRVTEVEGS